MSPARGLVPVLVAFALGAACGPMSPVASQDSTPLNKCPDFPCSAYQNAERLACSAGVCVQNGNLPASLVVVVSVPQTWAYAPGRTFGMFFSEVAGFNPKCGSQACIALPTVQQVQQVYVQSDQVEGEVHYDLGNEGLESVLPSRAMFRTLWQMDDGSYVEARNVGLPLDAITTDPFTDIQDSDRYAGPGGTRPLGFQTYLQSGSNYERTISPYPPFDRVFPPDVNQYAASAESASSLAVRVKGVDRTPSSEGQPIIPTYTFRKPPPSGSFEGWNTYLRSTSTQRRLSSYAVLTGAPMETAQLVSSRHPTGNPPNALENAELVVEPPAGEPTPTLATLQTPTIQDLVDYPAIPASAHVSGTVSSDTIPVAAEIVFVSTAIYSIDPTKIVQALSYTTRTRTSPDGFRNEAWAVDLPPGEYQVSIVPETEGYAKSIATLTVDRTSPNQAGKDLTANRLLSVRGTCLVSDGRPLSGAEVEARPAAHFASSKPDEKLPRTVRTRTDADGRFTLGVEPSAYDYDVIVRPPDGSRLPWLVSPSRTFGQGTDTVSFTVPPPIPAGRLLVDTFGNPIARAVVRFFALPQGVTAPSADTGKAYVEIGRTITDARGRYEMYLAFPQ